MSARSGEWDARTLALALDEVTVGLAPEERRELLARADARELEALEYAIAELNVAGLGELEAPPADLVRRLSADARAHFASQEGAPVGPSRIGPARIGPARRAPSFWTAAGWLVAAALLLLIALRRAPGPQDPGARRERLLASATDLVRARWSPSEDPLAGGLSGDVIWSPARQEGYMSFRSLPPNDPARSQYQLWVFDPTRAEWEAKPVDGGVFDVGSDEVVVPIDAKLEVRQAALFALTLEAPGGVVVSTREHLLATAKP